MADEDPDPDLKEGKQEKIKKELEDVYRKTLEEIKRSLKEVESSCPVSLGEYRIMVNSAKNLCLITMQDSFSKYYLPMILEKIEELYKNSEKKELSDKEKVKVVAYADALAALDGELEREYSPFVKETRKYLEKKGFKLKNVEEVRRYLFSNENLS